MAKIKDQIEKEKEFANTEPIKGEPEGEYRFDEKRHRHELLVDGEWKSLTGTTTVLGIVAKPFLIQWAANQAVDYIQSHINLQSETWPELFEDARAAHRKKKEAAGDIGKTAHQWVEDWIKDNSIPLPEDEMVKKMVENFTTWVANNKVKFLESERGVWSRKMFVGGIVDLVCEIDGEVWLCDIKTGGVYPEAFWQMASYQLCLEEMGLYKKIKGHIVLGILKDGTFVEKRSISNEENKKAFLACLEIYRIQKKVEGTLI